jgi:hypothetical protein
LVGAVVVSASCASPTVTKVEAFLTRDGRLVATPAQVTAGETIIEIRNDEQSRQRPVLVRRTAGPDPLPIEGGIVPVGAESDLEFEGSGYFLESKLDEMKAYFSGEPIISTIHIYLEPGTYELFSNLRGHYEGGKRATITVVDR